MSTSFDFSKATRRLTAATALGAAVTATVLSGCAAPAGTIDYVPPRAEPQSCRDLRDFDSDRAREAARGNQQIVTGILGAVSGALTGNESTRGSGMGAIAGTVGGEIYKKAEQASARAQLERQCNADIAALRQGVCTWDSHTNETTKTVNGRPVAVFEGDVTRSIPCEGIGGPVNSYRPPIDGRTYAPQF